MTNCTYCKAQIEEGTLICPNCGTHVAVKAKKEKIKALEENKRVFTAEFFKSPWYMVMAIFATVLAVASVGVIILNIIGLVSGFTSRTVIHLLESLGLAIIPTVPAYFLWKVRYYKLGPDGQMMNKINFYPTVMKAVWKVLVIVFGFILSALFIVTLFSVFTPYETAETLYGLSNSLVENTDFYNEFRGAANDVLVLSTSIIAEICGTLSDVFTFLAVVSHPFWLGLLIVLVTLIVLALVMAIVVFQYLGYAKLADTYISVKEVVVKERFGIGKGSFPLLLISAIISLALSVLGIIFTFVFSSDAPVSVILLWSVGIVIGLHMLANAIALRTVEKKEEEVDKEIELETAALKEIEKQTAALIDR